MFLSVFKKYIFFKEVLICIVFKPDPVVDPI